MSTHTLSLLEAVREGLADEMERDSRVVLLGEDIGRLGGVFRATDGLLDRFGAERVIDTPMAENAIAGIAMGLAMRGLRPVAEIQFADFMHAAMDHIVGEAAKLRYRTAGDWKTVGKGAAAHEVIGFRLLKRVPVASMTGSGRTIHLSDWSGRLVPIIVREGADTPQGETLLPRCLSPNWILTAIRCFQYSGQWS